MRDGIAVVMEVEMVVKVEELTKDNECRLGRLNGGWDVETFYAGSTACFLTYIHGSSLLPSMRNSFDTVIRIGKRNEKLACLGCLQNMPRLFASHAFNGNLQSLLRS